jgi:ribonuclease R
MSEKVKPPFPTKAKLLDYIEAQHKPVSRRDIARAFHIKGSDRIPMKAMLKELVTEGEVAHEDGSYHKHTKQELIIVEIYDVDDDGEFVAKPLQWDSKEPKPEIYIFAPKGPHGRKVAGLRVGDRALVSLHRLDKHSFEGRLVRKVEQRVEEQIIGEFFGNKLGGWIEPTDRRLPARFSVHINDVGDALTGDLVIADVPKGDRLGFPQAVVKKILGRAEDPKMFSVIGEIEQNLPNKFSQEAIELAENAKLPDLKDREDLRHIPLVTIDGADARDFDDAVWAAPDPKHEGGWEAIVAIADVAYYVRPHDALDKTALERGNSVYFPDRAIPMLPEALSNEMCSLKPDVDRACLAVHMTIDNKGHVRAFKFVRGLMRSVARLTYTQVQEAIDGKETHLTSEFIKTILKPLYGVYAVLKKERAHRCTVDLDLPERQVLFDQDGHLEKVVPRERYDSHRLIEELMIAANVCAAKALEEKKKPCMYRIHDRPDPAKVASLGQVLQSIGYPKLKSLDITQAGMNSMLRQAKGHEDEDLVNMLVLRTMAQASYSPNNVGHYGLNLQRYCHFTSPIRRYSDILVHRSLISAFGLGEGGLEPLDFEAVGVAISATERRAMLAERGTMDRFMAAYMSKEQEGEFDGKIVSVTQFGLFIMIAPVGATGYLPLRAMGDDYYAYQERTQELVGRRTRKTFRMGRKIKVGIKQVRTITGSIELTYIPEKKDNKRKPVKQKLTKR